MGDIIKESSTNQFNKRALLDRCGVNDTLSLIGKRWLMTVLYEISLGNNQFTALKKSVTEISEHVLAKRIADLTGQGLISKKEIGDTIPLQITYTVTEKGKQLLSLVNGLYHWNRHWYK